MKEKAGTGATQPVPGLRKMDRRARQPEVLRLGLRLENSLAASPVRTGKKKARKRGKAEQPAATASTARPEPGCDAAVPLEPHLRIGVLSDSHGYLDPALPGIFAGVAHIVHAGDIGDAAVLDALRAVAPVTAVAGNLEPEEIAASLPRSASGRVGRVTFLVGHKQRRLFKCLADGRAPLGPGDDLPQLVIYGHDHIPAAAWVEGILFLDPGTASAPNDEDDDPTVAIVEVGDAGLAVTFVPLSRREGGAGTPAGST